MNVRFDNEINNSKEIANINKYSNNNSFATNKESAVSHAASFSKNDNNNGINAYQDKKSITETALESGITDAKVQQDYMVVMSNTVSDEDYKKLEENGFKPSAMTPEESVTIVDKIKVTLAKSGQVIEGYNDDLDGSKVAEITGSTAYANEIAAAFNKYDVPLTDKNANEAAQAINMLANISSLNEGALKVMTEGNMEATIENIYTAQYSSNNVTGAAQGYFMDTNGYLGKKSDAVNDQAIEGRVSEIILAAGYDADKKTIEDAFTMIDEGMVLTEDSFSKYEELKSISFPIAIDDAAEAIARAIKDGYKAKDANISESGTMLDKAFNLVEKLENISEDAVREVVNSDSKLNIKNLDIAQRRIIAGNENNRKDVSQVDTATYRLINEVRLKMTVDSTYFLLKNGINVETEDLSLLVDELKEAENRQFEALFGKTYSANQEELSNLYDESIEKTAAIKNMPVETIGIVSTRTSFSLNIVYEEGKQLQSQFEKANQKYEPMMTEVRADLGDSIKKAFANVDDILSELKVDINLDNERAVKILAYSNQEINVDSIANIRAVYEKVHNIISKMTPAKTLELIRDGINPLEVSLDELEEKIDLNPIDPVEDAEKYSHFLYKMERDGKISSDERESFIGIYRMIHQIEKNDGAAIGTLVASNGEINFKNLMSAVRTRHNRGIDARIDDAYGRIEEIINKTPTITDQIEKAFSSDNISQMYDDIEDSYIRENADFIRENGNVSEQLVNLLMENDIKPTVDNLYAAKEITANRGKTFKNINKLSEKSTKSNGNVKNNVDNSEKLFDNVDKILESFNSKEEVQGIYSQMSDRINNFLSEESLKSGSYIDVKEIMLSMKQMSVISSLAKREVYEMPVKIEGEISSARVTVLHKDNTVPNVNILVESEGYGRVNASFGLLGENIEGYIVCSEESTVNMLRGYESGFKDNYNSQSEYSISRINYFKSSNTDVNYFERLADNNNNKSKISSNGLEEAEDKDGKDAISTKDLYKAAKEFIKLLAD